MAININGILRAYELLTGAKVCFHDLTGVLLPLLEVPFIQHRSVLCERIKPTHQKECTLFDGRACQLHARNNKDGFWKVCPAGILELYLPIYHGEELLAAIFCGQFRANTNEPAGTLIFEGQEFPKKNFRSDWESLPTLDHEKRDAFLLAGKLLCHQISSIILEKRNKERKITNEREKKILEYINRNFSKEITISMLAKELNLSITRTGHVVKSLFHKTFPQLINDFRIQKAKNLLIYTSQSINEISEQCGFKDPGYFFRLFKKTTQMPPQKYRQTIRNNKNIQATHGP